ncbi:vWA domain-containing protein [Yoonia sp. MH D7]
MTDDLNDLKSAMNAATPKANETRRADNLALAQKNFAALQGTANHARQTSANGQNALWTGAKTMLKTLTTKGGLTATTALVACGFMFMTPAGQDLLRRPMPFQDASEKSNALQNELAAPREDVVDMASGGDLMQPPPIPMGRIIEPVAVAPNAMPAAPANTLQRTQNAVAPIANEGVAMDEIMQPAQTFREPAAEDTAQPALDSSEEFANVAANPVKITSEEPVSTFSIDVDTASYSLIRSDLNRGVMPSPDAVRIEELINYFPYDYAGPEAGEAPFRPTVSMMQTPWNPDTQLLHIAIQGQMPETANRPPLNLVFLIDTSGSMSDINKLPLLKQSFRLMLDQLRAEDQIAIVEYAGSAGQVLAPTSASDRTTILQAISSLGAGGSTNGQGGLEQAYATAQTMAQDGEVNRVILATDGDFNVGINDADALKTFIETKRDSGTYLSVLGFGRGNLNDATMQSLAQNGNGIAAYFDTLSEAQKVLVDQLSGALFPIAGDVKVQVEFNPAVVAEYRLIGYETRALRREDFNNDAIDAGELGAGHTVTAIYEITPNGSPAQLSDPLRYGSPETSAENDEFGFLKLRYKNPSENISKLIELPITGTEPANFDAKFAASIAGFGQLLRGSDYLGDWNYAAAIDLANANRGPDNFGYRSEAVQLMRLAQSLANQ